MIDKKHIRRCLGIVIGLVGLLWAIRIYDAFFPPELNRFGIEPRTISGLVGIPLAPFLHESWTHLLSNTTPLLVLLLLLFASQSRAWLALLELVVLSGLLLWAIGRNSIHIGASAVIFSLITYLTVSGWLHRKISTAIVALLVLFVYGGVLLTGIVPQFNSNVSWEGHLAGAISGVIVAWQITRLEQKSSGARFEGLSETSP